MLVMTTLSAVPDEGTPTATFSAEVRALMGRHRVTQAQLADLIGVPGTAHSLRQTQLYMHVDDTQRRRGLLLLPDATQTDVESLTEAA